MIAGAGSAPSSPPEQRKMNQSQMQQQPQPSSGGGVGGFFSSLTQKAQNVAETAKNAALPKIKILLVIDDPQTDWLVIQIVCSLLICCLKQLIRFQTKYRAN